MSTPHFRGARRFALVTASALVVSGLLLAPISNKADASPQLPEWTPSASAPGPSVWTPSDAPLLRRSDGNNQAVAPSEFAGYALDVPAFETWLSRAPLERSGKAPISIQVPSPEGDLVTFRVVESPVMEPALAGDYPEISTWAGRSADGESTIRLDITPLGFHASVRGTGASWYVEPAYTGMDQDSDALYLSYRGDSLPEPQQALVEPAEMHDLAEESEHGSGDAAQRAAPGELVQLRTYRLALITDNTYARYFSTSSDPATVNRAVTSAKATLVNRLNQVFGDDLSIRLMLANGSDRANLNTTQAMFGANGPCGVEACYDSDEVQAGCSSALLSRTQLVLGQLVGADRYDVGHLALGVFGGGIAVRGAVGYSTKGRGCTGMPSPVGDAYALDYLAHELGHQFGANHTFNGTKKHCSDTHRSSATAVEPGSGSSVMSYAGVCYDDDLQAHSDPYFSQRSQQEITTVVGRTSRPDNEITDVSLIGFGSGDAFKLSFGNGPSAAIRKESNYTAAGIKAAVEAAEPSDATVTVTGMWGEASLANGFRLSWSGTANIPTAQLDVVSGSFKGRVGTTDNGGLCTNGGTVSTTGNHVPAVKAPAPRTIPKRTPFALTGTGSDVDGDTLVYSWEQNDPGTGTALLSNNKPNGPLFRIFGRASVLSDAAAERYGSSALNAASTSPTRYFPDLNQVLAGHTNAATGTCPEVNATRALSNGRVLECYSEFLPTTARVMNFRVTVRDLGGANGGSDGGVSFDDVALTVSPLGPFLVTSQAKPTTVLGGTEGTVTWTSGMASLAEEVKISMSVDGGRTFPHVLAAATPNDGKAQVTWPSTPTARGLIKVEAVDNYFYDLSAAPITITDPNDTTPPQASFASGPGNNAIVTDDTITFGLTASEPASTYECTLEGVPVSCAAGVVKIANAPPGALKLTVRATDAAGNTQRVPISRVIHVPVNDRDLKRVSGPWKKRTAGRNFRHTFQQVSAKGATLKMNVSRVTSVALVVERGPGMGAVKVLLNGKAIGKVDTSASKSKVRQVVKVASFSSARTGTLTLVTTSGKQVRISGVALRSR